MASMTSAYRIVSMGSTNNEADENIDTLGDCEEERDEGLNYLWDLFTREAETSADDATNEAPDSNIDGPKGRMVRMMKRSIQTNRNRKCRQNMVKKDRTDLVRIV